MKYRVVIRAFTLRRDVASAAILAKLLERQGCEVFIACVRNFNWVVKQWRPHAIVLNTIGKILPTRKVAPDALIFHQPSEGSEFLEQSDAMLFKKHPSSYDEVAGVFVWGKVPNSYYDEVMPGCDKSKLYLCGNPRLDLVKFNPDLLKNKEHSTSIGVVARFSQINDHNGAPTSHFLMRPWNLPRVMRQCIGFHVTMRLIERILEETDYRVSFRPYPLEAPGTYSTYPKSFLGERFDVDDSLDFANWVSHQRALVTQVSTTFLDPYLLRIPILSIDRIVDSFGSVNKWDGYVSMDAGEVPESIEAAVDLIKNGLPEPRPVPSVEDALENIHAYTMPGSALQRSAAIIVDKMRLTKFAPRPHMPRWAVELRDWLSFKRACYHDPFHVNLNYKSGHHRLPAYFDRIVDNTLAASATRAQ